jgi:hypothetical protein
MHVVIRIDPEHYVHPHQCSQGVQVRHHPTFRTHISLDELHAILRLVREKHGKGITIRQSYWKPEEADITLAYSQHHLTTSDIVMEFEAWVKNLLEQAFARQRTMA